MKPNDPGSPGRPQPATHSDESAGPGDSISPPIDAADSASFDHSDHDSRSELAQSQIGQTPKIQLDDTVRDSDEKIVLCQSILDYQFRDEELLRSALTHASGASSRLASNERLEFLGDSVLGLIVCQWLFEKYPHYSEGDLTKIKSAVVSRRSCATIACRLGFDECLIVGRGVTRNRSFPRSLVSDVFEAVIAALYLDGGLGAVTSRIRKWLQYEVDLAIASRGAGNFKSSLQQVAQRDHAATPCYRLVRETGPDHRKAFMMAAVISDHQYSAAWGNNKKDAEQRAAANALAELQGRNPPFGDTPTEAIDYRHETAATAPNPPSSDSLSPADDD